MADQLADWDVALLAPTLTMFHAAQLATSAVEKPMLCVHPCHSAHRTADRLVYDCAIVGVGVEQCADRAEEVLGPVLRDIGIPTCGLQHGAKSSAWCQ